MILTVLTPAILGHTYNWIASLLSLAVTIGLVALGRFVLFKVPSFGRTYGFNRGENRKKIKTEKFQGRLKTSNQVALATNLVFFLVIAPFITTFDAQPWWRVFVDTVVILMVYDFFYYWMHRTVFHGKGYFRMVHAVHHQARKPTLTSLDSLLLHPWEAFLGIALYMVVTTGYCLLAGVQMHVVTVILTSARGAPLPSVTLPMIRACDCAAALPADRSSTRAAPRQARESLVVMNPPESFPDFFSISCADSSARPAGSHRRTSLI